MILIGRAGRQTGGAGRGTEREDVMLPREAGAGLDRRHSILGLQPAAFALL